MVWKMRVRKYAVAAALALACLFTLIWGFVLCFGSPSAATAETDGAEHSPLRTYTAIQFKYLDESFDGLYSVTTAKGLKKLIAVEGTTDSNGLFTDPSSVYTLTHEEYVFIKAGVALNDADLIINGETESVTLTIRSGSATTSESFPIAEDDFDVSAISSVTVTIGASSITDDHTAESILQLITVTDQAGNKLRGDLFTVSLSINGSSATVSVTTVNGIASKPVSVRVAEAELLGLELSVDSAYRLEGLYYKGEDNTDAFVKGATPEEIFSKFVVTAIYANSRKPLTLSYNSQGQLSGAGKYEASSSNITAADDEAASREVDIKIGSVSASVIINFADKKVIAISADENAINSYIAERGITLYPYTVLNIGDFLNFITLTYNTGDAETAVTGTVQFVGSLVSPDILQAGDSYNKTIQVQSVADSSVSADVEIKNISYVQPTGISSDISGNFAEQTMHHEFNYENLQVTLRYGLVNSVTVNLSDFAKLDNWKDYIITELYTVPSEDVSDADKDSYGSIVTVNTQQVRLWFQYGTDGNGNPLLITSSIKFSNSLTINKDPVAIPALDTSTVNFSEGLTKVFNTADFSYGAKEFNHNYTMSVGIFDSAACDNPMSSAYAQYMNGEIKFLSGGTFFVKVSLAEESVREYEFRGVNTSSITYAADGSYVVYRIQINRGSLAVNLTLGDETFYYGDAVKPAVTGTSGGIVYDLINEESDAETTETGELYVPYKLVFLDAAHPYTDAYTYDSISAEGAYVVDPGATDNPKIAAGTYTVYAVTKETNAYLASRTRAGNGITVVINKKVLEIDSENGIKSVTYDRTTHDSDEFVDVSTVKFAYDDSADAVLKFTVDGALVHAGDYSVTIGLNDGYANNYVFKDEKTSVDVTFVIEKALNRFTITATNITYGNANVAPSYTINKTPPFYALLGESSVVYYEDDGTGNPKGAPIVNIDFATLAVGRYVAEFKTAYDYAQDAEGDYDLETVYVPFEVVKASLNRITVQSWSTDSQNPYIAGIYSGSAIDAILLNYLENNALPDGSGDIVTVNISGIRQDGTSGITTGYWQSGNQLFVTEAGIYTVTVTLNENYQWIGGGENTLTFYAEITQQTLSSLTLPDDTTYNGKSQTVFVTFSVGGADAAWTAGILEFDSVVGSDNENGTFTVSSAGDYTVTVTVVNANYKWGEGENTSLTYNVAKAALSVDWGEISFNFNESGAQDYPVPTANAGLGDDNALTGGLITTIYKDAGFATVVAPADLSAGEYYIKVTAFGETGVGANYYLPDLSTVFYILSVGLEIPELIQGGTSVEVDYRPNGSYYFLDYLVHSEYGERLSIAVRNKEGNNPALDIADTYYITVKPNTNYEWNDKTTTEYQFTFVIKPLAVEWKLDAGSHTYGDTAPDTATVTNKGNDSVKDDVKINLIYCASDNATAPADITNAGKYYAYAVSLSGAGAGNYTLEGVNRYLEYYVLKKEVALPVVVNQAGTYSGAPQTFAVTLGGAEIDATVTAVRPASWFGGEADVSFYNDTFSATSGVFYFTDAGYYSVIFTISDGGNYCWAGEDTRAFDRTVYTSAHEDFVKIERKAVTAPALGDYRAIEQEKVADNPLVNIFTGSVEGVDYTALYGERTGDNFNVYGTPQSAQADGGKLGQYYVLLILSENDKLNYVWNIDESDTRGSSFIKGNLNLVQYTEESGAVVYLHYAITASQVGITLTVGTGYIFGANGYAVGNDVLDPTTRVTFIQLDYGDFDYQTWVGSVTYTFYRNGSEISYEDLVNGLPWDVGTYKVKVEILFLKDSEGNEVYQDWENSEHEFVVSPRPVEVEWSYGGTNCAAGGTLTATYNGSGQLPTATVVNKVTKQAGAAAIEPVLVLNRTAVDTVNAAAYNVFISSLDGEAADNFALVSTGEILFVINRQVITVTGKNISAHMYGDSFDSYYYNSAYYTLTGTVYDEAFITVEIRDESGNRIDSPLDAHVNKAYYVVPVLTDANYQLSAADSSVYGLFKVIPRPITVTLANVSGVVESSVYYTEPKDVNDAKYYTVSGQGIPSGESAENVFFLSAPVDAKTGVGTYVISCTLKEGKESDYDLGYDDGAYFYKITPASFTNVSVEGYSDEYDAKAHPLFSSASATTVDGSSPVWYFKRADDASADWQIYTSAVTVRDAETVGYNVKVYEPNHGEFVFAEPITVEVRKATLFVAIYFEIYYGEKDPVGYNADGSNFKATLDDLRTQGGMYTVTGFAEGDDTSFYHLGDGFYGINGAFDYGYEGANYTLASGKGTYNLVFDANTLACGNYTFVAAEGNGRDVNVLVVKALPVTFAMNDFTAEYGMQNPPVPSAEDATIRVAVTSSYVSGGEIVLPDSYEDIIIDIYTSALLEFDGAYTTNDVSGSPYPISVTLQGNYIIVGSPQVARYTITKAQNAITGDYKLFTDSDSAKTESALTAAAWTYGNRSDKNPNGYDENVQVLNDVIMLCNEGALKITVYCGAETLGSTVVANGVANAKDTFQALFTNLYENSKFNAGTYRVVFEMDETTNYLQFEEAWYFKVEQKLLSITAQDFEVVYGEEAAAENFTKFKDDGLVTNGKRADTIGQVIISVTFVSDYAAGYAGGSVGEYAVYLKDSQKNVSYGELAGNYTIEFGEGTLTVTARKITIQITDLENHFDLLNWNGTEYKVEAESEYRFVLTEGSSFAEGDYTGMIAVGEKTLVTAQSVFVLKSEALTHETYRTNNQGIYPVYVAAGAHYYGGAGDPNYEITVDSPTYEGLTPAEAVAFGAGNFTILRAQFSITIDGPYYRNELNEETSCGYDNSVYVYVYAGYAMYFNAVLSLPEQVNIDVVAEYSELVSGTYKAIETGAPKDVGSYKVAFSSRNDNYEPAVSEKIYTITPRVINVDQIEVANAYDTHTQGNNYFFNGGEFTFTIPFSNFVAGETIALIAREENSLYEGQAVAESDKAAFLKGVYLLEGNAVVYTVRNAAQYKLILTLQNGENFLAKNYQFSGGDTYTFSRSILMETLTVQTDAATVQYGDELTDEKFRPIYTVFNITAAEGNFTYNLLVAENEKGYLTGQARYYTDYKVSESVWGGTYYLYLQDDCLTAYNFIVTPDKSSKKLSVVAREIEITVYGSTDGNEWATHVYEGGQANHNDFLQDLIHEHLSSFMGVTKNRIVGVFPRDYVKDEEFTQVSLSVPQTTYNVGNHEMKVALESGKYNIIIRYPNENNTAYYTITKASLFVTVEDVTVAYGTVISLEKDSTTFTIRYSGWKTDVYGNPEGSDYKVGSATSSGDTGLNGYSYVGGAYEQWTSGNGSKFVICPDYTDGFTNYEVVPVNGTLTVGQMIVTVTSNALTYTAADDGLNGGKSGAAHNVSLTFAGVPEEFYPAYEKVVYNTTAEESYTKAAGGAPVMAGNYSATVTLYGNGNFVFAGGDGYVNDYTYTFAHVVNRQEVSIGWTSNNIWVDPGNSRLNVADGFVAELMTVVTFTVTVGNGTPVEIKDESYVEYTADGGLQITVPNSGKYYLTVVFNADASRNYCWKGDEGATNNLISFEASMLDTAVTLTVEIADYVYGGSAEPDYAVLNVNNEKVPGAVVNFTYAALPAGFNTQNRVPAESDVASLGFGISVPQNAGWYVVRAYYGGSTDTSSATAYWVFEIQKAKVGIPVFTPNATVYTNTTALTADLEYNTQIVYIVSFDGTSYATTDTGATLRATNANAEGYTVRLALRSTDNYTWGTEDGEEITGISFIWKIAPAEDNAIVWNDTNVLKVAYGGTYSIGASSTYSTSVNIEFYDEDKDEWTVSRPSNAGTYRVRVTSAGTNNYNEAIAYETLVIERVTLTATPYGTLTYGQKFAEGSFSVVYSGFVNGDAVSVVIVDAIEFSLKDASLDQDNLQVKEGGYALELAVKDGFVAGVSAANYNIVLAGDGLLIVSPRTVTVLIGNKTVRYSEEADLSDVTVRPLGDWDSETSANFKEILGPVLETNANNESRVGTYRIYADDYANKNYEVTFIEGVYTVEALKVAIEITSLGGYYGDVIVGAQVSSVKTVDLDPAKEFSADAFTFTYRYNGTSNMGTVYNNVSECPVEAGTYVVTVTGISNVNYVLDGNVSTTFVISKQEIDASKLMIDKEGLIVSRAEYTGSAIEPVISDTFYNVAGRVLYTVMSHNDFVTVGTHPFYLELVDPYNYKWLSVDVPERLVFFEIINATNVLTEAIAIEGWTYGNYDAQNNSPTANTLFGGESLVFVYATSASAPESEWSSVVPANSNAGTYWVRVKVSGVENCNDFLSAPVSFVIAKAEVNAPVLVLDDSNLYYTGSEITALIDGFDSVGMGLEYDSISAGMDGFYLKALYAGTYTAKVALKNTVNYRWVEGTVCDEQGNALLVWTVGRKQIAKPTHNTGIFIVNGRILEYIPNGYDDSVMKIEGNRAGYGGTFTATVTLLDTANYEWADGSDGALSFEWKIVGSNTLFTVIITSLSAVTGIAAITAAVLLVLVRKKHRAEAAGLLDDGTDAAGENGNGEGGAQ